LLVSEVKDSDKIIRLHIAVLPIKVPQKMIGQVALEVLSVDVNGSETHYQIDGNRKQSNFLSNIPLIRRFEIDDIADTR
jgi:hypothetical protein